MRYLLILCVIVLMNVIFIEKISALGNVSSHNAILVDAETGEVLFEKNAKERQSIASITKVMTAIVAIESGKMNEIAKTSRKAIYTEGSSIYLEEGEKMTIEDLLYGLMLRSGNDAAVTIGEHIAGSEEGFVYLMNEKARWLGMQNTHFDNAHGLESETHYSTAYDMALLMRYAMKNDEFRKISGTKMHTAENRTYGWKNKNRLLTEKYKFCNGGKTGFTKKAGRTLLTTAKKGEQELISVTLNGPDDWNDHISMFEFGFNKPSTETLKNAQDEKFTEKTMRIFKLVLRVE